MVKYELLGYFLEFHDELGYKGCLRIEKKDREIIGYSGVMHSVAEETIVLDNKKKIKKGSEYRTYLYPLNGKIIK